MKQPKLLAFLLPQFHAIPENDAWWGEGFTEWTNVRKALSLFPGHRQPRVPLNARYYNLLDENCRKWQADLARAHGIHGFCYYHYWFAGRRLLERPLNAVLELKKPDFPFCLAWANEPWTRIWDGSENEVLMPQGYGGRSDWEAHFRTLEKAFHDPRYIRVNGCPVILIYRSASIVDCADMLDCWRTMAVNSGLGGLHVVSMLTAFGADPRSSLFDAFSEFEPFHTRDHLPFSAKVYEKAANVACRFAWKATGTGPYAPRSLDYRRIWRELSKRPLPANHYAGAFVDWDNSPRKNLQTSLVMRNFDLATFRSGFEALYRKASMASSEFVFINAWNEWGEGTYLEPDQENGTAILEIIKSVVSAAAPSRPEEGDAILDRVSIQ